LGTCSLAADVVAAPGMVRIIEAGEEMEMAGKQAAADCVDVAPSGWARPAAMPAVTPTADDEPPDDLQDAKPSLGFWNDR
jgi:hypothetical protein